MAQKKIYCYCVLLGTQQKAEKCVYVQARNAERAVQFVRRWIKISGTNVAHDRIRAIRWEKQLPIGTHVFNETDIPWTEG